MNRFATANHFVVHSGLNDVHLTTDKILLIRVVYVYFEWDSSVLSLSEVGAGQVAMMMDETYCFLRNQVRASVSCIEYL